jgi:uncharacterized protein DUF4345
MKNQRQGTSGSSGRAPRVWRTLPWVSRVLLVPPSALLIVIGLRIILDPVHAASPTGVALTTPEALTDTRVMGGLALALALTVASALLSTSRLRLGHGVLALAMGLILAVRLYGFAADGTTLAMGDQRLKTIGEVVLLVLNLAGFAAHTVGLRSGQLGSKVQVPEGAAARREGART